MKCPAIPPDLPADWADGLATLIARRTRRVLILGPTDVGKSRFAMALLASWAATNEAGRLLDADPGQKMVGPPGAVTIGEYDALGPAILKGLHFVGTTSAAAVGVIADGVGRLAGRAGDCPLAINSSGLVVGPGVPLSLRTIASAGVDQVVAIAPPTELERALVASGAPVIKLAKPAAARRKGRGERARRRHAAFEEHLRAAAALSLPRHRVRLAPPPTTCLASPDTRPVCALTDADDADMALGVLEAIDDESIHVAAPELSRPVAALRLGAMWARRTPSGWALVDEQLPAGR